MRVGGPRGPVRRRPQRVRAAGPRPVRRARAIPFLLLGRGSNLVIADAGFRGLVIQARAEGSRVDGDRYLADAGVPMARAATETQAAGLTGLEYGLAIPGTVGGAVWANAGAHGSETAGVLESATVLLADGTEAVLAGRRPRLRLSPQPVQGPARPATGPAEIILAAVFRLAPGDPARSRRASTTSAAGGASTSRWGSRRPAPCSATRRRFRGPADRRPRAQGLSYRRRRGLREARQLHRQRCARDRRRRPPPGGPRSGRGPGPPWHRPRVRGRVRGRLDRAWTTEEAA